MANSPNVSVSGGVQALSNAIAVAIIRQQAAQTHVSTVATGETANLGVSPSASLSTPAGTSFGGANNPGPSQRLVAGGNFFWGWG